MWSMTRNRHFLPLCSFFVFLPLTRTKMIDDPVIIMSLSINSRRFGCSISKQKLQHGHSLTRSDLKLNVICWSLFLPRFFFWLIGRLNLGDHPNSGLTRKSESILINCGFRGGFLRVLIGPSDGKYIVLAAVDKDGLLNTPWYLFKRGPVSIVIKSKILFQKNRKH